MYVRNPFNGKTLEELNFYLQSELLKLEAVFNEFTVNSIRLNINYTAPQKPEEGHVYYADGTEWNPGNGKGPYIYVGDEWLPMFLTTGQGIPLQLLRLVGKPPIFRNTTQKVSPPLKGVTFTTYAPNTR